MEVLKIDQNEDRRYKVIRGREIHKQKALTNKEYKRKKLGVIKKISEEELYSRVYGISGKIDEILFFKDNTGSPLDYKFAEYKNKVFKTYKIQSILYGILIKENFKIDVKRGFIVYTRSNNKLIEIEHRQKDIDNCKKILDKINDIIILGFFPKRTSFLSKCNDCCYRNICIK